MKVKKITWISSAAQEAEVEITDGTYSCVAFCQPCELKVGVDINEPLHAFITKNTMLSSNEEVSIGKISKDVFGHRCTAKVFDKSNGLVKVGSIIIELDSVIPPGAEYGTLIEFECSRLDIW